MDPITLALLGGSATLASTFMNSSAQNAVDAARSKVINDERARQQGFDTQAGQLNDQSLGRYSNFGDQMTAKTDQLAQLFKTPVITPNTQYTQAPLPPAQSDLVNREIATKDGIANNYVSHQADTLAALRSFGDLFGGIQRGQAKDAQLVGQIGGFKKGSQGVEQIELDNANRAGNTDKAWGDILGGLGKVGLTAGLSGAFAPAAAASVGANGAILGALGPTSVGGAPLVGVASQAAAQAPNIFSTGATPFLTYGR